ncbi:hypothetical protein ACFRCI_18610 [Streptomyces sp. NPDC056638]|uniref:hypothetical protein n=1 Tax=Streptomyces sp. NPDC056638 TaxID=3345887 RepID=UPI0036AD96D9
MAGSCPGTSWPLTPDLSRWKGLDEYAHVRRLGIVTDTEHHALDAARAQVSRRFKNAPDHSPTPPPG